MLELIIQQNEIQAEDVASVILTVTKDLNATFPAKAVRKIEGWDLVPLMRFLICTRGPEKCVRALVLINTDKSLAEIHHVYLEGAQVLRRDLKPSCN